MGIFTNAAQPNVTSIATARTNGSKQDKPAAKVWANIGYIHESIVDGETVSTFIGLPLGIPIDTMEKKSAGGSELMQAKNALLTKFQETGASMAPGEERIVLAEGGLAIQLRRVAERDEATAENNSFIASLETLAI